MIAILRLLIGALRDYFKSRRQLQAEVLVLRHQINILRRQVPGRVRPTASDRAIFVWLCVPKTSSALISCTPSMPALCTNSADRAPAQIGNLSGVCRIMARQEKPERLLPWPPPSFMRTSRSRRTSGQATGHRSALSAERKMWAMSVSTVSTDKGVAVSYKYE